MMKRFNEFVSGWVKAWRLRILWRDLAEVYGWNEMARMQGTLGAKLYCRLKSFDAEKRVNESGLAVVPRNSENPITITIDSRWRCPEIQFRESDWELMRVALAEHDERKAAEK